jgi:outer membrane protein assembly factor BamB
MKYSDLSRLRKRFLLACVALAVIVTVPARAQMGSGLITQEQAASVGLKRAWFARADVNPAYSQVTDWVLSQDTLFLVTNAGVLQAMDANTGESLWSTQFGSPLYPSLGPAANDTIVAVINGSTLYLMDRKSGRILSDRRVEGVPSAAPALSNEFVFVSTFTGKVEGYPLDPNAPNFSRWYYKSFGRALAPPLVTPNHLVWTTSDGFLYVARAHDPGVVFRLETMGQFDARPAYRDPLIFAVALSGDLFAVDENTGSLRWRYLTGYPTDRAPAAVGDKLFVSSEEPRLHCVDAATGLGQWESLGISQFAAVTKSHVYGVDRYGTIHILSINDGSPVGHITTGGTLDALVNDQTDRLFLISESGLVQCLHEIGADEPTHYVERPAATPEGESAAPAATTAPIESAAPTEPAATEPAEETEGFGEPAAEPEGNPFGTPSEEATPPPAESDFGVEDENPFD